MIRTMLTAAASAFLAVGVFAAEPRTEVKLLTIGNSFADSAFRYLPRVAESAGCKIVMDRANIGGCRLSRHWKLVEDSERDPKVKPYSRGTANLREMLERQKWDFVTIQQASDQSWRPESYQPYAKNLVEYVHKYAPEAEVVIQQTWAYRFDDGRLNSWKMDQKTMYGKLRAAYQKAAAELNLRVIPTGDAVQLARETQAVKYVPYDPAVLKGLQYPAELPSEAGSLAAGVYWQKGKDGSHRLRIDGAHLNRRGEYLQACLWFAFFFNRPTSEITFVPPEITPEDAKFLRETAQKALDAYEQVTTSADRR